MLELLVPVDHLLIGMDSLIRHITECLVIFKLLELLTFILGNCHKLAIG